MATQNYRQHGTQSTRMVHRLHFVSLTTVRETPNLCCTVLQRRNRQDLEQRVSLIPTVTSRELTGIWHRWILSIHLPQQKQSFLYAAEAARLRARWKREVLVLLPVLQDTGRNTTSFEVVLQSCTPLHRDKRPSSEPGLWAASVALRRGSRWGAVKGGPWASGRWLWAIQQGANPDPFLSPPSDQRLVGGWRQFFFPEIKFLEYSVLYRAITAWL